MNTHPNKTNPVEPEEDFVPKSGHHKMPLFLLAIWIANIIFFFYYFIRHGWGDLQMWLQR